MKLEIIQGDITNLNVDAIVNAANSSLLGGGGVDGAIHKMAGEGLYDACEKFPEIQEGVRLMPGEAVITEGYNLLAKYVIHTVGPRYSLVKSPRELLSNCYRNSLDLAEKYNLESIAFPAIGTGIYGYPKDEALKVTKEVINNFDYQRINGVILCYFSQGDMILAEEVFKG